MTQRIDFKNIQIMDQAVLAVTQLGEQLLLYLQGLIAQISTPPLSPPAGRSCLVKVGVTVKEFKFLCRSVKKFWGIFPSAASFLSSTSISQICGSACRRDSYYVAGDLRMPSPKGSGVYDMRSWSQNEITAASGRRGGRAPVEE